MAKFRKKPIVIDAEVYRPGVEDGFDNCFSMNFPELCQKWQNTGVETHVHSGGFYIQVPYINTLEGRHFVSPGDYIITGVKGERYPCKPDIFAASYELAEA